jgi:Replication-relaxation
MDTLIYGSSELPEEPPKAPKKRRPYYDRLPPEEALDINLTPRDKDILEAMYKFEGILTDQQLTRMFFNSQRRMKDRMGRLYQAGYVNRFTRKQRNAYDFMLYFLDTKGIAYLCDTWGKTEKELRPRRKDEQKHYIPHDVRLNDVRIAAMMELCRLPQTQLLDWINSRTFATQPEKVTYTDQGGEKMRQIKPDGYFHIETPSDDGLRDLRYFVELDNDTETNVDILVDKIHPFLAYRASERFTERFGKGGVRYLFVTTTPLKVRNLKRRVEGIEKGGVRICYFTTYQQATTPGAFFTQPIWYRATLDEPVSLLGKQGTADTT